MNRHIYSVTWIHRIMIMLVFIVTVTAVGAVTMMAVLNQPMPEILIALGLVAATGLVRLLVPILLIR